MTNATDAIQSLPRVPTGIAGLDTILRGGLLQSGLYLVAGAPGSGKTVLANQVCFNRVAAGERAAYVTLLAEAHSRMLAHLRPLTFFDPTPIGTELVYLSAYSALPEGGLDGLLDLLRGVIRDRAATLLVLDGLGPAADVAPSDPAFRRFLSELQAYAEAYRCTIVLLSQPLDDAVLGPVATMVDGVIELDDRDIGLLAVRELAVRKFRGSGYLRGRHIYDITDAGLVVHPRTEAILAASATAAVEERARLPLGLPGLAMMLLGGLVGGSTTMLLGPPGSGKTMLGLHFLAAGARAGEVGLHFGFYEQPARLIGKADGAGLDLGRYVREGRIEIVWQAPLEEGMDALAERLLAAVRERGTRRLFIDGLDGFVRTAGYPERVGRFFTALTNELRARDVTTIFSIELPTIVGPSLEVPIEGVSPIIENMIVLRSVEVDSRLARLISIVKTRESDYDPAIRAFAITARGIVVEEPFAGSGAVLTGTARSQPDEPAPANGADPPRD